MASLTGWKVLVNFLLPPPLLLTFLLVLPLPRNVRKGVLLFTSRFLAFPVVGGLKFVHLALLLSGVPLIDSGFRTFRSAQEASDRELTPNQRISVLAKKWREERNFWIAAMAFTLWCLLTVLYSQVLHSMKVHDQLDKLKEELDELKGIKRPEPGAKMTVAGAMASARAGMTSARAGMTSGLGGLGASLGGLTAGLGAKAKAARGKKDEGEPAASGNATDTAEFELTPGATTRRRAAAAATASS